MEVRGLFVAVSSLLPHVCPRNEVHAINLGSMGPSLLSHLASLALFKMESICHRVIKFCTSKCAYMPVITCVHLCEGQRLTLGIFLNLLPLYFYFEDSLLFIYHYYESVCMIRYGVRVPESMCGDQKTITWSQFELGSSSLCSKHLRLLNGIAGPSPSYYLQQSLSLNVELTDLARMGIELQGSASLCLPSSGMAGVPCTWLSHRFWVSKLRSWCLHGRHFPN